ncbi:MAG: hypothetical protein IKQ60_09825 [Candidatus Methanomethylophilaceae archaeon]|nr:hypothetical protein [Candidatus Methanomethylophilaceae archaeon]
MPGERCETADDSMAACFAEVGLEMLDERIAHFLSHSEESAVTGIRRMGQEKLVDHVASIAARAGMSASVYPDVSGATVLFRR